MSPTTQTPAGLPVTVTSLEHPSPPAPVSPPSSLDPEETTGTAIPAFRPTIDIGDLWRHSGWRADRAKVRAALSDLTTLTGPDAKPIVTARRHLAFCQCGADAYVDSRTIARGSSAPHTEYRLRQVKCHDRFCLPCSQERSLRIRTALLQHMHGRRNLTLITLTLRAVDQPLHQVLDRAYTHFKALRKSPVWANVHGGAAIAEVKLADFCGRKRWNVHWHVLCESRFIRQEDLSEQWRLITQDSYIVDIRRVGSLAGATSYITKYVTKAGDHSIIHSAEHLKEAITAFCGRRLVTTFGTWRGLKLLRDWSEDNAESETIPPWRTVGSLNDIWAQAQKGDAAAASILCSIRRPNFRRSGNPPPAGP